MKPVALAIALMALANCAGVTPSAPDSTAEPSSGFSGFAAPIVEELTFLDVVPAYMGAQLFEARTMAAGFSPEMTDGVVRQFIADNSCAIDTADAADLGALGRYMFARQQVELPVFDAWVRDNPQHSDLWQAALAGNGSDVVARAGQTPDGRAQYQYDAAGRVTGLAACSATGGL